MNWVSSCICWRSGIVSIGSIRDVHNAALGEDVVLFWAENREGLTLWISFAERISKHD